MWILLSSFIFLRRRRRLSSLLYVLHPIWSENNVTVIMERKNYQTIRRRRRRGEKSITNCCFFLGRSFFFLCGAIVWEAWFFRVASSLFMHSKLAMALEVRFCLFSGRCFAALKAKFDNVAQLIFLLSIFRLSIKYYFFPPLHSTLKCSIVNDLSAFKALVIYNFVFLTLLHNYHDYYKLTVTRLSLLLLVYVNYRSNN